MVWRHKSERAGERTAGSPSWLSVSCLPLMARVWLSVRQTYANWHVSLKVVTDDIVCWSPLLSSAVAGSAIDNDLAINIAIAIRNRHIDVALANLKVLSQLTCSANQLLSSTRWLMVDNGDGCWLRMVAAGGSAPRYILLKYYILYVSDIRKRQRRLISHFMPFAAVQCNWIIHRRHFLS